VAKGFRSIKSILDNFDLEEDRFISREFQKYGYELAQEFGDLSHKSLYILLAKKVPRKFLEEAKNFVKDAYKVKSKPRLFMWKLKELLAEKGLKMPTVRRKKTKKNPKV
jgi:hypothetical protein